MTAPTRSPQASLEPVMTEATLDRRLVLGGVAVPGAALATAGAYVDAFMAATIWSAADAQLVKATA
jgi:hypothetical protein